MRLKLYGKIWRQYDVVGVIGVTNPVPCPTYASERKNHLNIVSVAQKKK